MSTCKRAIRTMVLAVILATSATALYVAAKPSETVIKVVAKRFDYTPNVIKLKKGVPVVLELTSKDVIMGFSVPDFKVRADIIPGKVVRVSFVPDKSGTFTFVCDIFCGVGHERMDGTFIVTD
ncbi:MAG TPA: cytochrome c oxidase subunit II [Casimicrobiaceae bacterium]|nr:cytochrome c oxidase subunit II [Casimicrobiaceae bacterium]